MRVPFVPENRQAIAQQHVERDRNRLRAAKQRQHEKIVARSRKSPDKVSSC